MFASLQGAAEEAEREEGSEGEPSTPVYVSRYEHDFEGAPPPPPLPTHIPPPSAIASATAAFCRATQGCESSTNASGLRDPRREVSVACWHVAS